LTFLVIIAAISTGYLQSWLLGILGGFAVMGVLLGLSNLLDAHTRNAQRNAFLNWRNFMHFRTKSHSTSCSPHGLGMRL
ncbi:MAG TPA: hypothetical protein QGI39_14055, partial [Gammaproteobacteria bacterium]|nr:hypothetical protein [Gammaproteobacteria bacterium]